MQRYETLSRHTIRHSPNTYASQSIFSKHGIEFASYSIHFHILSANLLRLTHPSHQQFPPYRVLLQLLRILLPQSFYALKAKPQYRLLRSKGIQLMPVHTSNRPTHILLFPRQYNKKSKIISLFKYAID